MTVVEVGLLALTSFVVLFGFVLAFGAPYVPTLKGQSEEIFSLLRLKPGQTLVELGSGDGKILIQAANRGIKSVGYELNPLLVVFSRIRCYRYRSLVKVKWANFWRHTLPECDAIYTFLLPKYMSKLDKKITQEISHPVKLVSFAFRIPHKEPVKEKNGLLLYLYHQKAGRSASL